MKDRIVAADRLELPRMYWLLTWFKRLGLKNLARELEKILTERVENYIDPVTSLVQRRYFMRELTREVTQQFPDLEAKGVLPHTSTITVLVGDLAILNFFNATSHKLGDEVLSRTGKILLDEFDQSVVSRIGGDEFAIFCTDEIAEVLERKKSAQTKIEEKPLNILDIEYATIDDVRALLVLYPLPDERRVKFVVQALTDIAMARAQIAKYYARISLLIDAYIARNGLYEDIIGYARKGAGNITDEAISEFALRTEQEDDVSLDCLAFALNAKAASGRGDLYEEAIFQVAESIFVHQN